MKASTLKLLACIISMFLYLGIAVSCSDDDNDTTVNITVNEGPSGDIGGDFTGNGGTGSRTINWTNNLATADYNVDITATSVGTFKIVIGDADGQIVLNRLLNGGTEPDSIDGVTQTGTPGIWTVTITLTSFDGDGSYSLSEGN